MYTVSLVSGGYGTYYFELSKNEKSYYIDKMVAKAFGLEVEEYQKRLIALLKRNNLEIGLGCIDVVFKFNGIYCNKLIKQFKDEFTKELVALELEG